MQNFIYANHGYKTVVQKFVMHSELNIVHSTTTSTKYKMKRKMDIMVALATVGSEYQIINEMSTVY
jgi:hypothetical protein